MNCKNINWYDILCIKFYTKTTENSNERNTIYENLFKKFVVKLCASIFEVTDISASNDAIKIIEMLFIFFL